MGNREKTAWPAVPEELRRWRELLEPGWIVGLSPARRTHTGLATAFCGAVSWLRYVLRSHRLAGWLTGCW